MAAPFSDRLILQHFCHEQGSELTLSLPAVDESTTDLLCDACGSVLRIQTHIFTAEEYAGEH